MADDYTADQIEQGIASAIKARDFSAVVSLLKMLAIRDPHRAEVMHAAMLAVLPERCDEWATPRPATRIPASGTTGGTAPRQTSA